MEMLYLTITVQSVDDNYVYVEGNCRIAGIPGFTELGVVLPLPGAPSANTMRNALRTYAIDQIESATGVTIPPGQVVIWGPS